MSEEINSGLIQDVRDLETVTYHVGDSDRTDKKGDSDGTDAEDNDGMDSGDADGTDSGDADGTDGDSDGTDNA